MQCSGCWQFHSTLSIVVVLLSYYSTYAVMMPLPVLRLYNAPRNSTSDSKILDCRISLLNTLPVKRLFEIIVLVPVLYSYCTLNSFAYSYNT